VDVVLFISKPPVLTQARTRMTHVWYKDGTGIMDSQVCLFRKL